MSDADLVKLYSGRILALAADIPHLGRLAAPQGTARRRSPLCGSTVTVDVVLQDGRVAEFAQDVKACALGQASAAVLGAAVIGRSLAELETARDALRAMLKDGGPVPAAPFDGYEVLHPGARLPQPPRLDPAGAGGGLRGWSPKPPPPADKKTAAHRVGWRRQVACLGARRTGDRLGTERGRGRARGYRPQAESVRQRPAGQGLQKASRTARQHPRTSSAIEGW